MRKEKREMADPSYTDYLFADGERDRSAFSRTLRVAFLRNDTVEMLLPVIRGEIAAAGAYPEVWLGDYDTITQDVLADDSALYAFHPDVICMFADLRNVSPLYAHAFSTLDEQGAAAEEARITAWMKLLLDRLQERSSATVVCHTFVGRGTPSAGILDLQQRPSERQFVAALNHAWYAQVQQHPGACLLDLEGVVCRMGVDVALDERAWAVAKNPFTRQAMVAIGREYGKFFRTMLGSVKKCIVLDCDNTLWGGIIGEDGPHGIRIGEAYPGCCYQALQEEVLHLRRRGILVALCSKNNEADVREVFDTNPDMLLKADDIAAAEINWEPKPDNLRRLAERLNLGLDSFVFVDDSPFECGLVREALPEVGVVELSGDPSGFAERLRNSGWFNALRVTADDRARTENYHAEALRQERKASAASLDDYLQGLQMKAVLTIDDAAAIPRVAQMTQKTNQFNLTTRRYTEAAVRALVERADASVLSMRLADDISDLGIIGLAMLVYRGDVAEIDTFLLSCRALGRRADQALMSVAMRVAAAHGCRWMEGCYLPTPKNRQVEGLYGTLGFERMPDRDGIAWWHRSLTGELLPPPACIEVTVQDSKGVLLHGK